MKIYNYDLQFCYTGSSDARKDPLETLAKGYDVFMLPARATTIPTPDIVLGEHECFIFTGSEWIINEDYRGVILYRITDGDEMFCSTIGPIPEGYALEPPVPAIEQDTPTRPAGE